MREPDAHDAARVLAVALVPIAGAIALQRVGAAQGAALLMQVAFLAVPLVYARAAGLGALAGNGYVRIPLRRVLYVLVASLGSFWLLNGLTHLQDLAARSMGLEERAQAQVEQIRKGIDAAQKAGVAPTLVLFVIIPPLCEETFFRGLLFRGVAKRFGTGAALAGTSILFAWFHPMDVQKVLMVFLGCYFGLLVCLTGSLWAGILAHALNNLTVIVMMWIYKGKLPDFVAPWWMYVLSAVVFALGLTLLALDRPPSATVSTTLER
ncbi:MAG: CPBP family intramembrane metalloprotease [Planctomycetes bacterium]|nr:CPBP family intramembrane metalloprotease [Planctomycetota bacterium]